MSTRLALLPLVALASACQPSPGAVNKSWGEAEFKVQDSIFMPIVVDGRVVGGELVLADKPNLCESARSGYMPSRMKALVFRVVRLTQSDYLAPDIGKYQVVDDKPSVAGSYAFGELIESDLNCTQTLAPTESVQNSGDVTIDAFETGENGVVSGTFSTVKVYSEDFFLLDLKGQFNAEYCVTAAQKFSCR